MKYMNAKKKYQTLDLQLFAGEGEGDDGGDAGDDDQDDDSDDDDDRDGDDPDEKKFSQKDVDDAVKKRLAREKRKWQRDQQKKSDSGNKAGDGKKDDDESSKAAKAMESRALKAEAKNACYEAGVSKDSVDDVVALARSYMDADEDLDLEDAIEKVVKKYPHFKKGADDSDDEGEGKKKSWGQRQSGKGGKKLSGVEKRFYQLNPDLKE